MNTIETSGRENIEEPHRGLCITACCRRVALLLVLVLALPVHAQTAEPTPPSPPDEKLGERLIRRVARDGEEDLMATIIRMMQESARLLDIDFDAGTQTQQMQREILDKLDEAIRTAAAQLRRSASSQSRFRGDDRRRPDAARDQQAGRAEAGREGEESAESASTRSPDDGETLDPAHGELLETRRTWGLLPQRQRDEVIQGASEAFLERYRYWIERYYQALQESPQ